MISRTADKDPIVSDYREFRPPVALQQHVLCLWAQSIVGAPGEHAHRVLPDACVDVVFINHDAPMVVGPWAEPFTAHFPSGTKVVGVRFHPGRASGVLGLPASSLFNQSVALRDVWPHSVHAPFARVIDEPTIPARLVTLEAALRGRLLNEAPPDSEVRACIGWLASHPDARVEKLSQWLGISHRHLQRRFSTAVGYGPKLFQSVLRFQRLLHLASNAPEPQSLSNLAAAAGYADQAHMTREVARFAGSPPSKLLRSAECTLEMSDLFKTASAARA